MTVSTFVNALEPDEKQIAEFLQEGPDEPIFMINLLKFRKEAKYEDGRDSDLTGKEAYRLYGRETAKHLEKVGGKVVFVGDVTRIAIGNVSDLWDEVAVAVYPSRAAMVNMSLDSDFQASAVHRTAGLEGQLNIETTLMPSFEERYGDVGL